MIIEIRLPEGEQLFGEGTVLSWKIKEGDTVRKGEVMAEIETPKAVIEFESPENGVVTRLLVEEGASFPMKDTLALLDRSGAPAVGPAASIGAAIPSTGNEPSASAGGESAPRIPASPAAKRIAREKGIDLSKVRGTGPGGRIVESDILAFAEAGAPASTAPETPADKTVPLSPMRRAVAGRLVHSWQSSPHFYLTTEVDAGRLWAEYTRLKSAAGISLNDFVVKAAAEALGEFPEVNSSVQGDVQIFRKEINIGVAVRVEGGIRIPVLRSADRMTIDEISSATKGLVRKAREGTVEGSGTGTFTISNLGMHDVTEFAAVINPPEAAILAVGKVREAAVVRNGVVSAGRIMAMTLSCDHRAFDGVTGAKFLQRIKTILEASGG
jgi:pyruvate dehydrogenase E2 component (dihydrolipoamide acetyltransferase)